MATRFLTGEGGKDKFEEDFNVSRFKRDVVALGLYLTASITASVWLTEVSNVIVDKIPDLHLLPSTRDILMTSSMMNAVGAGLIILFITNAAFMGYNGKLK